MGWSKLQGSGISNLLCLLKVGLTQYKFDYSLFTKHENEGFIVVLVYVDDIVTDN